MTRIATRGLTLQITFSHAHTSHGRSCQNHQHSRKECRGTRPPYCAALLKSLWPRHHQGFQEQSTSPCWWPSMGRSRLLSLCAVAEHRCGSAAVDMYTLSKSSIHMYHAVLSPPLPTIHLPSRTYPCDALCRPCSGCNRPGGMCAALSDDARRQYPHAGCAATRGGRRCCQLV